MDRHVFVKRARVWVNADGFLSPLDELNLIAFTPGPPAHWTFVANAGDGRAAEIHLSVDMLDKRNCTVMHFSRPKQAPAQGQDLPAECDVRLTVRFDIEDRSFHCETKNQGGADSYFQSNCHPLKEHAGFDFTPASDRSLKVYCTRGNYHAQPEWCVNIPHPVEQSRGQMDCGDAFSPGWFEIPLPKSGSTSLVLTADPQMPTPAQITSFEQRRQRLNALACSRAHAARKDEFGRQLAIATQAYVVKRDSGKTVIAGYPWFLDWGRDSLIAARGLLAAGMKQDVIQILSVFGAFEQNGTLPNSIHGKDASNRDTSDAPLWYGIVCEETAHVAGADLYKTHVATHGKTVAQVLASIAEGYLRGTPNGIHIDRDSGLVWSPSHFTWMDTNYPAASPREGYPIEIQALWIRLLQQLARLESHHKGQTVPDSLRDIIGNSWASLASLAEQSLIRYFWEPSRGYLADLLPAKVHVPASRSAPGNELRSNCLLAIALGVVKGEPARKTVLNARRQLLVPGAIRSLAPLPVSPSMPIIGNQGQLLNDPNRPYWGHYEGDEDTRRKPAYHNGTAWTWSLPIFCEALVKAWEHSPAAVRAASAYLGALDRIMSESCLGQIPEILDGDAPHTPRGCDAQAWGVTEALRVWKWLNSLNQSHE